MKKILVAVIAFSLFTSSKTFAQSSVDSAKLIEELAYKLSKSPTYISFMQETQKVAQAVMSRNSSDKNEFRKHSKEDFDKVINNKDLTSEQKADSLKKMGMPLPNTSTMQALGLQLAAEFPELAKLGKERSKLVVSKATALLKADGFKFYTPSAPTPDNSRASDYDKVFTKTEKSPMFPGGAEAFKKYLERNLNKDLAAKNGAPAGVYNVKVQFIIDSEGNVSNVKAVDVPKECPDCGAEAVKVIRKGPKWQPAVQNGRNVTFQYIQTISFPVTAL